ncbi:E3 ubiquitin-protein ligase TRIM68-like [Cheilinus undulatus]|uniref:E3 ubiquitin-protein ligase TRIM68-like n=1 Tax=Cheilinus undulatus TaxID=241271 RepID=UPI001BD6AA07|nr:E3 ubiquitin-protein ligase TRIM68-like [Cheilinus undulatus]
MSTTSCELSEEQFRCSICLDMFTDPVSIPCGHNFCKRCIIRNWDVNMRCECPLCKKAFNRRPELFVNTFIAEIASQFRRSMKKTRRFLIHRCSSSGEVRCDICIKTKVKALKSCLTCLTSYCKTHLEFHQKMIGQTKHDLIDPVGNLEERMCKNHHRPLEMFCKTDQTCICLGCTESSHKLHPILPLMEQYEEKKAELRETEVEIHKMIEERRLKIQTLKDSVRLSREDADRELAEGVAVFTALIRSAEERLVQLLNFIEEKQKTTEERAEGFIKELEDEISKLMKSANKVKQLSQTEDPLQFLQNLPSCPAPPTKDWTQVHVHSSFEGTVRRAVAELEEKLSEEMENQRESELERVQQYTVDVTLDPNTANPSLILSDDRIRVHHGKQQNVPDNPERFSKSACVLGEQSFTAGKFYFEVEVTGKSEWELGVALGSMNRKEEIFPSRETGPWVLQLRSGSYYIAVGDVFVLKSKPRRVGVFVDYEEGLVSFYDVDTAALIYSFTDCKFRGKLYPYLNPLGDNHALLIVTPVIP